MALPFSILRVKRKADEAPLNALVIEESRRRAAKRAKDGGLDDTPALGMFRLVQTVQSGWQGQGEEAEALKIRIKEMQSQQNASGSPPAANQALPKADHALFAKRYPSASAGPRLRVIKPIGRAASGRMSMPTSSRSSMAAGAKNAASVIRLIDAVQDEAMPLVAPPSPPRPGFMPSGAVMPDASAFMSAEDAEMIRAQEEYGSMLEEAMAEEQRKKASVASRKPLVDLTKPVPILPPPLYPPPMSPAGKMEWPKYTEPIEGEEEGEYVYDLYFRDARGGEGAVAGASSDLIGALTGYEELLDEEDGGSDTEEEDEADEDSNDEDFYRNDYPEDPEDDEYPEGHDADDDEDDRAYYNRDVRRGDDGDRDRDGFEEEAQNDPEEHHVRRLIRKMQMQSLHGDGDENE